jgi:hypothetical protein
MRDYQRYSVSGADAFDNTKRWERLILFFIQEVMDGCPLKGMYLRFLDMEIYFSEQSLARKLNKLRHMGLMDANDHNIQGN